MEARYQLVRLLADGHPRSAALLARRLGVSRARVAGLLAELGAALDLHVETLRGRGYRLTPPLELLDPARILAQLSAPARQRLAALDVLAEVDSTNGHVLAHPARGAGGAVVCLAEMQTAGRGRRGRAWVSPFGANLYLSLLERLPRGPAALAGLSLCVGIAAARAVARLGVAGVALKWPNDLLLEGRKLGGILLEMSAAGSATTDVIAGVGINVRVSERAGARIDQAFADLHGAGVAVARNRLAAGLIEEVLGVNERFLREGFAGFRDEWRRLDGLHGHEVELTGAPGVALRGRAHGVDAQGALLLEVDGERRRIVSADVSVRSVGASVAVVSP